MNRRYKKGTGIGVIAFVVLIIFGIVTFKKIELNAQIKDNEVKINDLNTAEQEQGERADEINELKAYVETKAYIEDEAREKLGMVYPDEYIFSPE